MKAEFHKTFDKQLAELPKKRRDKVVKTVGLFLDDPLDTVLRNPALSGEWAGFRSISAGGDLRLHFETINNDIAHFVAVGSHSQLYKQLDRSALIAESLRETLAWEEKEQLDATLARAYSDTAKEDNQINEEWDVVSGDSL